MKKRSFILIEALVSITLLFIAGFGSFEFQKVLIRKAKSEIRKADAEIAYNLALSSLIEKVYTGEYRAFLDHKEWTTNSYELEQNKEWSVKYRFKKCREPKEKPILAFISSVSIVSLEHKEWGECIEQIDPKNGFEFCVVLQ